MGGDDVSTTEPVETIPEVVAAPVVEAAPVVAEAAPVVVETVATEAPLVKRVNRAEKTTEAETTETTETPATTEATEATEATAVTAPSEAEAFKLAEIERRRSRAERFGIPFKEPVAAPAPVAPKANRKEKKFEAKKEKRAAFAENKAKEVSYFYP